MTKMVRRGGGFLKGMALIRHFQNSVRTNHKQLPFCDSCHEMDMCSGDGLVTKYGEMELAMSVQEMDMSQNMARWSWPRVVRRWTCENFGEMELAMGCQEMDLSKSSGDGGNIFLTARWTFLFLARWSWPWVVRRWSQEMEWRDGVGHGLSGDGVARWTREMELAMHVQEMESGNGVEWLVGLESDNRQNGAIQYVWASVCYFPSALTT